MDQKTSTQARVRDLENVNLPTYVLITPAWNEVKFIEQTIKSVVAQTVRPAKWAIVSDGSTDGTDEVVRKYVAQYPWVELIRMPKRPDRNFAGKVHAFNAGYKAMNDIPYQVIGSLDADVSFDEDYFAFLLQKLAENPRVGLAGTAFIEGTHQKYDYRFASIEHVSGMCQLFRRECFEAIGGYVPVKSGGIDLIAVVSARMRGWQTRTYPEKRCIHHRVMGTAQSGSLKVWYTYGIKDYTFGCHPIWQLFRSVYQMTKKPFIIGGVLLGSGYISGFLKRVQRPVTKEWVAFRQREQMQRLKRALFGSSASKAKIVTNSQEAR